MVKILGYLVIVLVALSSLTFISFKKKEITNNCRIKILTSNSFYNGVGKELNSLYSKKYSCDLNFVVVSGGNLVTNLFLKQTSAFDVLMGLDIFQIQKMNKSLLLNISFLNSKENLEENESDSRVDSNYFVAYDESPITFFLRKTKKSEFENLNMFLHYTHSNRITLAVPLKTTSVLGSLFDLWMKENIVDSNFRFTQIKYSKSWSEAFGLFERKIVDGFLSFETSEIFYLNDLEVSKVKLKEGHPNLREYFAYSANSYLTAKQKKEFYEFIKSNVVQNLILKKNYMWPVSSPDHEYKNLRNLNIIKLAPKNLVEQKE